MIGSLDRDSTLSVTFGLEEGVGLGILSHIYMRAYVGINHDARCSFQIGFSWDRHFTPCTRHSG